MNIVLASASPRRRELLSLLVREFSCEPTHIDETVSAGESPKEYVLRLAREKAQAAPRPDALIIAADTTVALGDIILGKPADRAEATRMLSTLSGREHWVHTGLAVHFGGRVEALCVSTAVVFAELNAYLIESYLDTDEPWDKAGSYGIQGLAGSFVKEIRGSYSAVVGLPLVETRELLELFDCAPEWSR